MCHDRGFCVATEDSHKDGLLCRDKPLFIAIVFGHDRALSAQ